MLITDTNHQQYVFANTKDVAADSFDINLPADNSFVQHGQQPKVIFHFSFKTILLFIFILQAVLNQQLMTGFENDDESASICSPPHHHNDDQSFIGSDSDDSDDMKRFQYERQKGDEVFSIIEQRRNIANDAMHSSPKELTSTHRFEISFLSILYSYFLIL